MPKYVGLETRPITIMIQESAVYQFSQDLQVCDLRYVLFWNVTLERHSGEIVTWFESEDETHDYQQDGLTGPVPRSSPYFNNVERHIMSVLSFYRPSFE